MMHFIQKTKKNHNVKMEKNVLNCSIQSSCGLCPHVNNDYQTSLSQKHQKSIEAFSAELSLNNVAVLKPIKSTPFGFRTLAKLAVRRQGNQNKIGLFQVNSHRVVEIKDCPLHHAKINIIVKRIADFMDQHNILAWSDEFKRGDIGYLVVRVSKATQETMLTLVVPTLAVKKLFLPLAQNLVHSQLVSSVFLNINNFSGNEIFGEKSHRLFGANYLRESLAGSRLRVSPKSFLQTNPTIAEAIYHRLGQIVGTCEEKGQQLALDLYSGIGLISMVLARNGFRVIAIEENPSAIADAQNNMSLNGFLPEDMDFLCGKVEDVDLYEKLTEVRKYPEVIVINPSRRGLDVKVRDQLKDLLKRNPNNFTKLLYVSCSQKTLIRDLKDLLEDSPLKLRQLESFDMFCHSDDLEWLAVLTT